MMGWMRRHLDGRYVRVGQQTGIYFGFGSASVEVLNTWTEKGRARAGCQRLEGGRI
jgi:hypothetical protein